MRDARGEQPAARPSVRRPALGGAQDMNAALVIAVALLPFALVAIALYRTLLACVIRLGLRPMVAVLLYWAAVAILPVGILWLQVPLANNIFTAFPALQTAAWDVGLAVSLTLAMLVSWLIGIVAAILAGQRFPRGKGHAI